MPLGQPGIIQVANAQELGINEKTLLVCKAGAPTRSFLCARLWFANEIPPPSCGGISQNWKFLRLKTSVPCKNIQKPNVFNMWVCWF